MLSDERIAEIAETHIGRLKDIGHKSGLVIRTDAELACESAIRNALAEAAVRSQFKPGERGQVVEIAAQVPVMGEAVAEAYVYEDVDGDDILGLRLLKEDYPMQHGEKLYIEPTTSITHAELDAKDARIVRQHRQIIEEMVRTEAVKQELGALRKDAERYRWIKLHANVIEWHLQDEDGTRLHEIPTLDADIDRAMVAK